MDNGPDTDPSGGKIQASWKGWALLASWVVAIVGNFVLVPPFEFEQGHEGKLSNPLVYLSTVLVTVFVALAVVPALGLRDPSKARLWRRVALGSLVAAVVALAVYIPYYFRKVLDCDACPVPGKSRVVLCGTDDGLQKEVRDYLQTTRDTNKNPYDCRFIAENYGCAPSLIWTRDSRIEVWRRLAAGYILCSVLWSVAILSVALAASPGTQAPGG